MKKLVFWAVILLFFSFSVLAVTAGWTKQTSKDLNQIHQLLVQNTMQYVDKEPYFMYWLDEGKKAAEELAKKSNTMAGYYYALAYYTRGFHNGHINVGISGKLNYKFAGLLLKYQNRKYLVRYRNLGYKPLPPVGSELISCDNKPVQDIINNDIILFRFVPKLESSYNQAANYLFYDANPFRKYPKQCVFRIKEKKKKYNLNWKLIPYPQTKNIEKQFVHHYPFRIQTFGKKGLWISVPTLFPENTDRKFLQTIVNQMLLFRDFDPIVFDVRGNGGGSSIWALRLLYGLYGKVFVNQVLKENDHSYEVWRISKKNVDHIARTSKLYPSQEFMAKELKRAYDAGKNVDKIIDESMFIKSLNVEKNKIQEKSLFNNHIYFLTDNHCFSSCLDFADYIHWLPNTTHVGLPTNADSPYTNDNDLSLPGGAHFMYTMKVWRNRPRGNNQPYIPKYRYIGDINDTPLVMQWVEKLYFEKKF